MALPPLRQQAVDVMAVGGCDCGCGTIDLVPAPGATPASVRNYVPVEANLQNVDGAPIGGVLLFVADGLLDRLEVYSYGDSGPLEMPPVERLIR